MYKTFQPADGGVSGCEFLPAPVCENVFHSERSSKRHWCAVYDRRLSQPSTKNKRLLADAIYKNCHENLMNTRCCYTQGNTYGIQAQIV